MLAVGKLLFDLLGPKVRYACLVQVLMGKAAKRERKTLHY